jgi:hypothetical protein
LPFNVGIKGGLSVNKNSFGSISFSMFDKEFIVSK